jgi:hypothetical protein
MHVHWNLSLSQKVTTNLEWLRLEHHLPSSLGLQMIFIVAYTDEIYFRWWSRHAMTFLLLESF